MSLEERLRTAGCSLHLSQYSDDDIRRLLSLRQKYAVANPDEPVNDQPYDKVTGKYFYHCDIEKEAATRGITESDSGSALATEQA
jgi:hypothetical protein